MATILVRNLFGGDPGAAGVYTQIDSYTWTKGTYSFIGDVGGQWELEGSSGILETATGASVVSPSLVVWTQYTVADIASPGTLPINPGASESISSPGTILPVSPGAAVSPGQITPVSPGVPDVPANYVGTFEQSLTATQQTQALNNINLSSLANGYFGTTSVANKAARLALDKTLSRVIQDDKIGVLWLLIAEDPSLDASWIGIPYTLDPEGDIIVSMELADVDGIITDANVLGHVGGVLSIGDGATTGGNLIPSTLLLASDPVQTSFVTITGTLTSDGSTSIATPVNLPLTGVDNYTDGATLILAYSEPSDQWSLNDGAVAEWLSGVGEGFAAATWTPQGTETGTPVAVLTEATAGTPGQLAMVADGGVWLYDALGVWQEIL